MLGVGLRSRPFKCIAEAIDEDGPEGPSRAILNDCSLLVDGRPGNVWLTLGFSSLLRLCLCPGRCKRWRVDDVEPFWVGSRFWFGKKDSGAPGMSCAQMLARET